MNHLRRCEGARPLERPFVEQFVGDGTAALLDRVLGPVDEAVGSSRLRTFLEFYEAHCLDRTRLYPGIRRALATLRAGGRSISVVTNKPEALARRILQGLCVLDEMTAIVGGDTLATRKPEPHGVWHVLEMADAPAERAVVVGDLPIDAETARAAGACFVGAGWGFQPARLRSVPSVVVARDAEHMLALIEDDTLPCDLDSVDVDR